MSCLERKQNILRLLSLSQSERPSMTIREIADTLFYSESSVRRDVRELEARGLVNHLWGGVTLSAGKGGIVPVILRDDEHSEKKERIAREAAELVRDGDTIILDSSSTVRRMLQYLTERRGICIITNNSRVFDVELPKSFRLCCTGGSYHPENHNFLGASAEAYLRTVRADVLFFSSQGLNEAGEISDVSEEETSIRRVMLSRAERKFFLCDSSKIGVTRRFVLCTVSDIDGVISDAPERVPKIIKE